MISNWHKMKTRTVNTRIARRQGSAKTYSYSYQLRSENDLHLVSGKIPDFLANLKEFSIQLAASKAGFRWDDWKDVLIANCPDVKSAHQEYLDRKHGKNIG